MRLKDTQATYDEVPYDGGLAPGTHPDRMAVLASLFGVEPPPVETARILEIGCGVGSNLIPMAYSLPQAILLGIDPSPRQIEMANAAAGSAGLTNVSFSVADIRDYESLGGPFDYIVCHGVFSWVPDDVRTSILEACRALVPENGLSVVTYNALPGFYTRAAFRDALRFHVQHFSDSEERIAQARGLGAFLKEAAARVNPTGSPYATLLRAEAELIESHSDAYIVHEHLAEQNTPFYYREFVDLADAAGLVCVADSDFSTMVLERFPPEVKAQVYEISPDEVALEQFNDFLTNRMFRRTIVARDTVQLDRAIKPERIMRLLVRTLTSPTGDGHWKIAKTEGVTADVRGDAVVAVLEVLHDAVPAVLSFDQLFERIPDAAWPPATSDTAARREHLCGILLSLFAHDAIEFRVYRPRVAETLSERPRAYWPAREAWKRDVTWLPGPFHNSLSFKPFVRALLPHLDGTRTVDELVSTMEQHYEGEGAVDDDDKPVPIRRLVERSLEVLRQGGLLEPELR